MKRRNLQKINNLLLTISTLGQLAQVKVFLLETENRDLKTEMARLRAGLADWLYAASEKS